MIKFHTLIASGFSVAVVAVCVLAVSDAASARGGGGGGGGGHSAGSRPGRPSPPVFLDGSAAGRAVSSGCTTVSTKPVTDGSGTVTRYRRVQVCD
jgi:hypothetical protein